MSAGAIRKVICLAMLMVAGASGAARCQEVRVTLLGTGTPAPVMNRFGPSILVEAGGQKSCSTLVGDLFNVSSSRRSVGAT